MPQFNPLVNGVEYAWVDITVNILGRQVPGITSIEYGDSREKQNNFGAGTNPVSRSRGKRVPENVKMTLYKSEMQGLQAIAPNGNIDDIPPFDIVVSYTNSEQVNVTDTIKNCEFMGNKRSASEGSAEGIKVELELICSHVEWSV